MVYVVNLKLLTLTVVKPPSVTEFLRQVTPVLLWPVLIFSFHKKLLGKVLTVKVCSYARI